ncbi:hypothetical protein SAMN05444162_2901 [Paenibacillaceae bacterium GAS479]|nr:hypothetical protein SAMN05444162_2901 [Paenibacillaceae bacterium GAS479]
MSSLPSVSIHAPARGATANASNNVVDHAFQSTLPHGERPTYLSKMGTIRCFNPRSRTGSDMGRQGRLSPDKCFNPRSRTGSDHIAARSGRMGRGFNPRSRTGSDYRPSYPIPKLGGFNPRSRTGSDESNWGQSKLTKVSIHAPARGATFCD